MCKGKGYPNPTDLFTNPSKTLNKLLHVPEGIMRGTVIHKAVISKILSVCNEPYKLRLLLSQAVTNVRTN